MPTSRQTPVDPAVVAVGTQIAARRKAAGMTQEALGLASGVLPPEVSKIERGLQDPRLSTVLRIAAALEISAADLIS